MRACAGQYGGLCAQGGVGKSIIVVNTAVCLAKLGKSVLIVDADLGLANIDVFFGLAPPFNLNHFLSPFLLPSLRDDILPVL